MKSILFLVSFVCLLPLAVFAGEVSPDEKIKEPDYIGMMVKGNIKNGDVMLNFLLPYPKEADSPVYFLSGPLSALIIHSVVVDGEEIAPRRYFAHKSPTYALDIKTDIYVYPRYLRKNLQDGNFNLMAPINAGIDPRIFEIPSSAQEIDITYSGLYQIQGGDIYHGQEKYLMRFVSEPPKVVQDSFNSKTSGVSILRPDSRD